MAAATKEQISRWFDDGVSDKAAYMIVVCDTFDYEDYPVYADTNEQALSEFWRNNGKNMQRVMEVYDLRRPKEAQLAEHRAFHLPEMETSDE